MNLKKWMKNIGNETDIFTLNIPGTHDCVTQFVQFSHISRCQNTDIYGQLSLGVRALDIRVKSVGDDRLGMVHGIANAFVKRSHLSRHMEMGDVLSHCYRFLNENKSEALIFQFKNDSAKEQEKCFDILYNTYISAKPEMWFCENRAPRMGEARGKIVLIRRCNKYGGREYPLGTGIDFSRWVEQDTAVPEPLTLETGGAEPMRFVVQDRFKYKPEPRWSECIKPFLDKAGAFDGTYVIDYLSTAGGLKGPYNNSKYINPRFLAYPLADGAYYGTIYTDFPDTKLTEKIIRSNNADFDS